MECVVRSTKPAQFRLPAWVHQFLEEQAEQRSESKTQVIIDAVSCMKDREVGALMREGYEDCSARTHAEAEASLQAGTEAWPEW